MKNKLIIAALIKFLKSKGKRYDVPDTIVCDLRTNEVHLRGSSAKKFPDEFYAALEITTNAELFAALKTVTVNPHLGESQFFNVTFTRPDEDGA